jgi:hypothetical protein
MTDATASSASASGLGRSDIPGTGAPVSVMNAGYSGIRKNEMPSEPAARVVPEAVSSPLRLRPRFDRLSVTPGYFAGSTYV